MKRWKKYSLSLALATGFTSSALAQIPAAPAAAPAPAAAGVAAAPGAPGVPDAVGVPMPGGIMGNMFTTCEYLRAKMCACPMGQMLGAMMQPMTAFSGGLIHPLCPPNRVTAAELAMPADSALGAAARIKADEAQAGARRAAVRYLGTADCRYWPEAQEALATALRADRNECVRWEAAMALGSGCCCTPVTIEALSITVEGSDRDGNPAEVSDRVKAAAEAALAHCLARMEPTPIEAIPIDERRDVERKDVSSTGGQTPGGPQARSADMARAVEHAKAALAGRKSSTHEQGARVTYWAQDGLVGLARASLNPSAGATVISSDAVPAPNALALEPVPSAPTAPHNVPAPAVPAPFAMPAQHQGPVISQPSQAPVKQAPVLTPVPAPSLAPAPQPVTVPPLPAPALTPAPKPVTVPPLPAPAPVPSQAPAPQPVTVPPLPAPSQMSGSRPATVVPPATAPAPRLVASTPAPLPAVSSAPAPLPAVTNIPATRPAATSAPAPLPTVTNSSAPLPVVSSALRTTTIVTVAASSPAPVSGTMSPLSAAPIPVTRPAPAAGSAVTPAVARAPTAGSAVTLTMARAPAAGPQPTVAPARDQVAEHLALLESGTLAKDRAWAAGLLVGTDWHSRPAIAEGLLTAAVGDPAPEVRLACIATLVQLHVDTRSAAGWLQSITAVDSDPRVRRAAADALARLPATRP